MPLATTLADYIRAAFSGLYVETHEPAEALRELADLCRQEQWTLATWDIDQGLSVLGCTNPMSAAATDPLAALRSLPALAVRVGRGQLDGRLREPRLRLLCVCLGRVERRLRARA